MIIAYHKTRKVFYVLKGNKKQNRKFLFSSKDLTDCRLYCTRAGASYTMARSAMIASSRPTQVSDATRRDELVRDPGIAAAARDASDDLASISRLAKVIHGAIGNPGEPWENYLNDAKQVMYQVKALERKRV